MEDRETMGTAAVHHDPHSFLLSPDEWSAASLGARIGDDRILVVLNQPMSAHKAFQHSFRESDWHIYADGGGDRVRDLQACTPVNDLRSCGLLVPHILVGDFDSLTQEAERDFLDHGVLVARDPDQYSTDFGKALKAARILQAFNSEEDFEDTFAYRKGVRDRIEFDEFADRAHAYLRRENEKPPPVKKKDHTHTVDIVVYCSLGGRVDQGLGLLSELMREQINAHQQSLEQHTQDWHFWLASDRSLSWILEGPQRGSGHETQQHVLQLSAQGAKLVFPSVFTRNVGIIPVYGPAQISTKGLEWDVTEWRTEMGGQVSTSNHVVSEDGVVEIWTTGPVLFTVELSAAMITG